ncbi:MAG: SGNH/GDSL hydrolase family protein [Clostridiales bacterium]|nr:SGNH/GDSL hydrolase family protein [Clostridiales bacterium]
MVILFQGDSITDVGRNTTNGSTASLGQGYPLMVTGDLGAKYPNAFSFINRGISGNRIVDVYARIKCDIWNLSPDVLSVLIGVNDVWHEQNGNGVDAVRFERVYDMLVSDTIERFPNIRMLLLEPFVLPGESTDEGWELFHTEVPLRAAAVRRIAAKYGQVFVPLQQMFDEACTRAPAAHWLPDGVHPSAAGHRLIADAWEKAFFSEIYKA